MTEPNTEPTSRDFFGPRDLLLSAVGLHVVGGLVLAPLVLTALVWSLSSLYYGGIHNFRLNTLPYPGGAFLLVVTFIWAWRRRQRWLPAAVFTLLTLVFWLAVVLPYTRLLQ